MYFKHIVIISFTMLCYEIVTAQKVGKIQVLGANSFEYDANKTGKVRKLIGNVRLKQDNTLLFCDSAYQYEDKNYVEAFNNVHINVSDSVNIYGDVLKYDGNSKHARFEGNVKMSDQHMQLTTTEVDYDITTHNTYYTKGGKIVSGANILVSKNGNYNTFNKIFLFKKDVVLTNPDYIIKSDTLKQNTKNDLTYFLGPTFISSQNDSIYCENGWYDNKKDIAMFSKNAKLSNSDKTLFADSIYYYKKKQFGKAYRNIYLFDKANEVEIRGQFGEFDGRLKKSYVTQKSYAKKMMKNDSMYLLADTIYSFQYDSILNQTQLVKAYPKAYILKYDIQSASDSLVYNYNDSTIKLFDKPILWSGQNQITADTIVMYLNNNKLDSFHLLSNAFLASRETAKNFNQVKGKIMNGFFEDNKIKKIKVYGNGQSIFYAKDENDSSYIGVNVINCSEMEFIFEDNKLQKSRFITQPEATFYPILELKPEELKLKGFKWQAARRPTINFLITRGLKN